MDPVRFGLVGYGFGGRYFHAPLLAAAPEVHLLGVVTTSVERRAQVAAEPVTGERAETLGVGDGEARALHARHRSGCRSRFVRTAVRPVS